MRQADAEYPPKSRNDAIWYLAKRIRETMERFDATGSPSWDCLDPEDQQFYFDVVEATLDAKEAVLVACEAGYAGSSPVVHPIARSSIW